MLKTALIVKVPPSAELVALRQRHASDAANGVPPHITVLFPFMAVADLHGSNLDRLRRVIGSFRTFDFALTDTGWFGKHVLWLAPADPEPFIELTEAVSADFPQYPPYGGAHDGSTPHATVGDSGDFAELTNAAAAVNPLLPIKGTAAAVTVIAECANGIWRDLVEAPLSNRR